MALQAPMPSRKSQAPGAWPAWPRRAVLRLASRGSSVLCTEQRTTFCGDGCAELEDNDSLNWACLGSKTVLACSFNGVKAVLSMELRVRASSEVHSAVIGSSSALAES